jgi:hypothetical protein
MKQNWVFFLFDLFYYYCYWFYCCGWYGCCGGSAIWDESGYNLRYEISTEVEP